MLEEVELTMAKVNYLQPMALEVALEKLEELRASQV